LVGRTGRLPGLPEDAARIGSPGTLSKDAFRTGPTA